MKKAVAYARYSSDNQSENSIEAQLDAIEEFCKTKGIALMHSYIDRAESGRSVDRDEFQMMLNEIQTNSYDYVIFHKSDRLARNRIEAILTKKEIRETGAEVVFVVGGNFDTETPEGMMMESLVETLDEYYSMNLSRETKKGMNNIARKGLHTGGRPPLGYDLNDNKEYIINPTEAEAVKLVYNLFLQNYGYLKISQELNDNGFRTKLGRKFSKTSIYEIVRNEKYTGTMVFNKHAKGRDNRNERADVIKVENAFEPMIDKKTFLEVQAKLNERLKPRMNSGRHYLLTGKVKCECGSSFVGNQYGSGKYKYYWYTCTNNKNNLGCDVKAVKAEELEKHAIKVMLEEILTKSFVEKIAKEYKVYVEEANKTSNKELRSLQIKKATNESHMNKMLDLLLDGLITNEQFKERTEQFKHELDLIDLRLEEMAKNKPNVDLEAQLKRFINKFDVDKVYNNKKLAHALLGEFIDLISITSGVIELAYKVGDPYPIIILSYNYERLGLKQISNSYKFL